MLTTRFTELVGCTIPLQQAGMGVPASPDLAAAVAAAGGLGMVGGVLIPAPALAAMLDALRVHATGPVGVNFLLPFVDRAAVEVAASRVRVVEFFYGDPDRALVELVHAGGALAVWQVGSATEALAAEAAGCDFIVVQGAEAGGHVRGTVGLLALLDAVLDQVRVPIVAAGGIGSGRTMAAALAAGADAVRVGTRFVAAAEADAHPTYVAQLLVAEAQDTVITETFSATWPNAPHRVLRSCVAAAAAFPGDIVAEMVRGGQPRPVPRFAPPAPGRQTTGAVAAMALYAGESVGKVQRVQPAAAIVRELAEEAERRLRGWRTTTDPTTSA